MSASDLGLRAAASLETSVGSYIALAAYRRLFTSEAAVREGAILGAVRCAMDLDDEPALLACADAWRTLPRSGGPSMVEAAAALLARGRSVPAEKLASAERQRSGAPRAAYIEARAKDALAPSAVDDSGDSLGRWWHVHRAGVEAKDALVTSLAAARYAGLAFARCSRDPAFVLPRENLSSACEVADDTLLGEREARLPLLRGKLLSPSKFKRAAALSSLADLASRGGPLGLRALSVALRHADSLPTRLHPLEVDRIRACAKHLTEAERDRVGAALDKKATLGPRNEAAVSRAELAAETSRLGPDFPVPRRLANAALELLHADSLEDREAGALFLDAMLKRTTTLPPCSLSLLGAKLLSLAFSDAALRVFDEALRFREPEALRYRGFVLRQRAFEAAERGDVEEAWSELSAARAILVGAIP